ncbi:kinase-like domain-containing protein, partial [Coemansia spiralis]
MTAPLKGLKDEPSLTICPIDTHEQYPPTGNFAPIAVSLKSSRQFLLNTPLGEFEVERTIGQGSYGKVKLMRSSLTNEQFAVKIIKRYTNKRERKARTLDRRLHPHIVPLHDFRATDTHFYLFYSFVDGVTLAERVGTKGLLEDDALAVFKPTAETIWFCHKYSIIHRDIKLENVLISAANGDVKLIDFGLANFFDGTSLMETFCGSLPYTAPEILRGDAYVGPEIDVWSLGVLLYVMLTGQFPFEDPAQTKNFDKIMRGDFRFPPGISCELSELLVMMLEPKPAKRISMQGVLEHPWL